MESLEIKLTEKLLSWATVAYVKENTHTHTHTYIYTYTSHTANTPHRHIHPTQTYTHIHNTLRHTYRSNKTHTYIPPSPPYTLHITYKPQTYEKFFLSKVVDLPKANDPYVLPTFSLLHVLHFNANLFILLNSFSHYTETPIIPDSMGTW